MIISCKWFMRKIVLFIAISFFHVWVQGQTGEEIYTLSGNDFKIKNKFIDAFFRLCQAIDIKIFLQEEKR